MPSVNYTYSVLFDTLNGRVESSTLTKEIAASNITIALDYIDVVDDVLNIWFKVALSSVETDELTLLVASHSGDVGIIDNPDTIIAQLTLEGRNLLARAKLGDVVYKHLGWQVGRGGYIVENPVKITDFIDNASEAQGYFDLVDNTAWALGTYISLNGKNFIYGTHFEAGATADITIKNIQNVILDSLDLRHYRMVLPIIDPAIPTRLYINSLLTGEIGNSYPISVYHVGTHVNIGIMGETIISGTRNLSGGTSTFLESPAWPVPPTLAPYLGTEGIIEIPASTALSFTSRIGEGISGMGAYGELGLWVQILDSKYPLEIGNKVLYAMSHFPIQPKTDRTIATFKIVISF